MVTTFRVPDMTCGHCASTIAAAVRARDPAARVEFDIREHLVRISSAAATEAELRSAIRAAGYKPIQVQSPAAEPARVACRGCGCAASAARTVDVPQSGASAIGGCCS